MNTIRFSPEVFARDITISPVYRSFDTEGFEQSAILPDLNSSQDLPGMRREQLLARTDTPRTALVEVFPAPKSLLEAAVRYSEEDTDAGRAQAQEELVQVGLDVGGTYATNSAGLPGKLSATTSPVSGLAPGLHFDGRDNLPLGQRIESRRRLGVNAGPGDRWLFVCIPDIMAMCDRLGVDDQKIPTPNDWQKFATTYLEEIDCIRIPVPAESAYLLGTDIAVHEGSTLGAKDRSHAFFWLGHWTAGQFTD